MTLVGQVCQWLLTLTKELAISDEGRSWIWKHVPYFGSFDPVHVIHGYKDV